MMAEPNLTDANVRSNVDSEPSTSSNDPSTAPFAPLTTLATSAPASTTGAGLGSNSEVIPPHEESAPDPVVSTPLTIYTNEDGSRATPQPLTPTSRRLSPPQPPSPKSRRPSTFQPTRSRYSSILASAPTTSTQPGTASNTVSPAPHLANFSRNTPTTSTQAATASNIVSPALHLANSSADQPTACNNLPGYRDLTAVNLPPVPRLPAQRSPRMAIAGPSNAAQSVTGPSSSLEEEK